MIRHAVAVAAALAVHLLLWDASYAVFSRSVDFNAGALEDFMGPYYGTARSLAEGSGPAPGFLYGPFFAVLLLPFAKLAPDVASWVWLAVELAATAALVVLAARVARPVSGRVSALFTFVALTAFPLVHNLHWGQVSALLGVLALGAAAGHLGGRPALAAWLLAAATAIKGYPALLLAPLLLTGPWRAAAHFAVASAVLGLGVPAALIGPGETLATYRHALVELASLDAPGGAWRDAPNKQVLGAVLARWSGVAGTAARVALVAVAWLWAAANLALAARRAADGSRGGRLEAWVLVVLSLPLVVSPSWPHYLVLLPFAQLALATSRGRDPLAVACVAASVVLASAPFFRAVGDPVAYGRAGWLAAANLLLLAAAYRPPGRGQPSSPA